jgi:hypothetical protein
VPAETEEEMLSACRPITRAKVSNGSVDLPKDFDSGQCWGAFGMLHGVLFLNEPGDNRASHSCVSEDATRTQLIAIFVKYIEAHPKENGDSLHLVAINPIIDAYPCNKKMNARRKF